MGDYPTSRRHFCCRSCWLNLFARGPPDWKCPVCRESVKDWLPDQFGATVRIERFDRDSVRLFVHAAIHHMFSPDASPMSPGTQAILRTVGWRIISDAESSDSAAEESSSASEGIMSALFASDDDEGDNAP